jgi:hypothetical protein
MHSQATTERGKLGGTAGQRQRSCDYEKPEARRSDVPPEGRHEVGIALERRAAGQRARSLVREDGHVLLVAAPKLGIPRPVCEKQVWILLPCLQRQPKNEVSSTT